MTATEPTSPAGPLPYSIAADGISYAGHSYRFPKLDHADFDAIREHIASRRPNPVAVVAEAYAALPPDVAARLMDQAYADAKAGKVTDEDLAKYLASGSGRVFAIWWAARKGGATISLEDFYVFLNDFVTNAMWADLQKKMPDTTRAETEAIMAELLGGASHTVAVERFMARFEAAVGSPAAAA